MQGFVYPPQKYVIAKTTSIITYNYLDNVKYVIQGFNGRQELQ